MVSAIPACSRESLCDRKSPVNFPQFQLQFTGGCSLHYGQAASEGDDATPPCIVIAAPTILLSELECPCRLMERSSPRYFPSFAHQAKEHYSLTTIDPRLQPTCPGIAPSPALNDYALRE